MTLGLHNLHPKKSARRNRRRIGRGNATGQGTYAGRGQKGQRSRSGGKGGLKRRGLRRMLQNKPKIGGFRSPHPKLQTVDLDQLEKFFSAGSLVDRKRLIAAKLIKTRGAGIKILGRGKLTKALKVTADNFSESAKKAILDAGGSIEKTVKPKPTKNKSKNKNKKK